MTKAMLSLLWPYVAWPYKCYAGEGVWGSPGIRRSMQKQRLTELCKIPWWMIHSSHLQVMRERLTRTSVPSVLKEGNLLMQATLRKKPTDKNKGKQMGRINHNLPKTENVWIFENCLRAYRRNHSLNECPSERGSVFKQGQMTSNRSSHPQQQQKRNHGNEGSHWNDPIEIINTNETTKTTRLKQTKPSKQAKTPNRWKPAC